MINKTNIISNVNNVATDQREDPAIWKDKELQKKPFKTLIKGRVGKGINGEKPSSGVAASGGSIASPLTEQSHTFWDAKILPTSDGLFTIAFANYKTETYKDANDAEVVFNKLDS